MLELVVVLDLRLCEYCGWCELCELCEFCSPLRPCLFPCLPIACVNPLLLIQKKILFSTCQI